MSDTEKVEALVQLAGSVAHELNNIFTAVTGNLSLLEDSLPDESDHARVISDVIRTAHRGIELSEKLQAFAGRQRLRLTRVDLNRAITTVATDLKRSVLRSIDVKLHLGPGCFASCDRDKMMHVLEELAKNAATAMDFRGQLDIGAAQTRLLPQQVQRLREGDYVKIVLRDSGCGMRPEIMKRAMDPVFSTDSGRPGWGLARCAGFIRQCGGEILLASNVGHGTSVEIFLPVG